MKRFSLVIMAMSWLLLTSCKNTTVSDSSVTSQRTTTESSQAEVASLDRLLDLFAREGVILKELELDTLDEDVTTKALYATALTIYEFEIEPESGISVDNLPQGNELRTGKIMAFADSATLDNFVTTLSERVYFDVLGVDTNYVNPLLFVNKEPHLVLQLNQFTSETFVKKYEQLFQQ